MERVFIDGTGPPYGAQGSAGPRGVPPKAIRMGDGGGLRFRIRRGDLEVELEGDFEYVRGKFEDLLEKMVAQISGPRPEGPQAALPLELSGIVELGQDGRPRLTVPVENLTAKEAIALLLYSIHPSRLSDEDLSSILSSSWKTTGTDAVRARASELRREGRLVAERGEYCLSGAGLQWVRNEIIPRLKGPSP
ncbi:MAG: hypothetical protein QXN33_04410 [Candidatus Bathyarchaeia archaeon]